MNTSAVFTINSGDLFSLSQNRLCIAASNRVVESFGMDDVILLVAAPEMAQLLEQWYEEAMDFPGTLFLRQEGCAIEVSLVDRSNNKVGARYADHGISRTPDTGLVPVRCTVGAKAAYGMRVQELEVYSPILHCLHE